MIHQTLEMILSHMEHYVTLGDFGKEISQEAGLLLISPGPGFVLAAVRSPEQGLRNQIWAVNRSGMMVECWFPEIGVESSSPCAPLKVSCSERQWLIPVMQLVVAHLSMCSCF